MICFGFQPVSFGEGMMKLHVDFSNEEQEILLACLAILDTAKSRFNGNRQYFQGPLEIERTLVAKISETGKEQLKKRRKAGLSSFYARSKYCL